MRNFLQPSAVIRVTAPYTLASGDGCLVGALFGMATGPVASGNAFDMLTTGVFENVNAASAAVATVGEKAYWDDAARKLTSVSSGNVLVGVFSAAKTNGQLLASVAIGVSVDGDGGGGGGAWGGITGPLSSQTDLQAALDTKAIAYAPVSINSNTTLTRAAHYNRLIVVDVSGGNVTLTATGTDALLGDFISVDVIGGGSNTVTLAGVTAKPGYRLTANNGEVVELCCVAPGSFVPVTPETAALVESLSALHVLAAADDKKRFTCTTALAIEVPTGLSPAPSCIAVPPAAGNLTLSPTGGATFNGSASALTRTFANNRNGVLIEPSPYTVNDYSVSGS